MSISTSLNLRAKARRVSRHPRRSLSGVEGIGRRLTYVDFDFAQSAGKDSKGLANILDAP